MSAGNRVLYDSGERVRFLELPRQGPDYRFELTVAETCIEMDERLARRVLEALQAGLKQSQERDPHE